MKIAILAWGSLVWDPRKLSVVGDAQKDGPILLIEFSRISADKRLTLVIDEKHGTSVASRYYVSADTKLDEAIAHLQEREGIPTAEWVGFVNINTGEVSRAAQTSHPLAVDRIRAWGKNAGFDAVVWTALNSNFQNEALEPFSPDAAVRYLVALAVDEKAAAIEYIENAPVEVDTPVRRLVTTHIASPVSTGGAGNLAALAVDEKAAAIEYIENAPVEVDTPVRRLVTAHIASPVSTGGAGTVLEHRYAASCVALMLCRGEMPFFPGSTIEEVSVQTGSLGWRTDDVLVRGTFSNGSRFTLAAQAKRTCVPTASDTDFVDFITSAWADFISPDRFTKNF